MDIHLHRAADAEAERQQRLELADLIERRARDIVDRWLEQARADADSAQVSIADLRNGLDDYLARLAELLRSREPLQRIGTDAWQDVAHEHAVARVRLGFDVAQLMWEIIALRQITTQLLREEGVEGGQRLEAFTDLAEAAMNASVRCYVESRDDMARRAEAQHIGSLAHELKTPLGVASMAVARLRHAALSSHDRLRLHDMIDRSLERIRRLIDDALLTGRLQAGEMESRLIDTTLGQVTRDAIPLFERASRQKGLEFRADLDPGLPVRIDPNLTVSALQNLLDNAIKYTESGDVRLEVEDGPDYIVVHIRDSCAGLSPEQLRVIFEPFRRAHSGTSGSGLGLAIARQAVERQGGRLFAESSLGVGCHFWFTLPKRAGPSVTQAPSPVDSAESNR